MADKPKLAFKVEFYVTNGRIGKEVEMAKSLPNDFPSYLDTNIHFGKVCN